MGGYPFAEHDNWKPGNARTTGAGSNKITLGEAYKRGINILTNKLYIAVCMISHCLAHLIKYIYIIS